MDIKCIGLYVFLTKANEILPGITKSTFLLYMIWPNCRADGKGFYSLQGQKSCPFYTKVQTGCVSHPAFCSFGKGFLSPGVKRPGRQADNASQTTVEVTNERSYFLLPLYVFMAFQGKILALHSLLSVLQINSCTYCKDVSCNLHPNKQRKLAYKSIIRISDDVYYYTYV